MAQIRPVVTSFLSNGDAYIILLRSDKVSSYQGKWAAVSGSIEEGETVLEAAFREIKEETGIPSHRLCYRARARESDILYGAFTWRVHPLLFECDTRDVRLDWEHNDYRWVTRSELAGYDTVPALVESLDAVRKRSD
jgi:8-oxo-dGTP pyrophosphatase MutT (NUDIX family)